MAKETPAERRERMYQEAVAAARASQNVAAPAAAPMPAQSPQMPSGRTGVSTSQLLNAQARQQWMSEVESGATTLPFVDWWNLRAAGFTPNR